MQRDRWLRPELLRGWAAIATAPPLPPGTDLRKAGSSSWASRAPPTPALASWFTHPVQGLCRREQTPPWGPAAWDPGHPVSTQRAAAAGVCLSLSTHWDLPGPHADPGRRLLPTLWAPPRLPALGWQVGDGAQEVSQFLFQAGLRRGEQRAEARVIEQSLGFHSSCQRRGWVSPGWGRSAMEWAELQYSRFQSQARRP